MLSNSVPVVLVAVRAGSLIAMLSIGACIDPQHDTVLDKPDSNMSVNESALAARPLFQMPFACGEEWRLSTYAGHDDFEIDMIRRSGTSSGRPIVASFAGSVMASGFASGAGNRVRLYHGDGWQTEYYHMIAKPIVSVGQQVQQGQVLGHVGSTGDSGTPHLHYAQRANGTPSSMGTVVRSYFNGVAADITDDARANAYVEISRNCSGGAGPQSPDGVAPDFDGDSKGDLVGTWADGTMTAYLNIGTPGQPSFANQRNIGTGWNNIARIVVVDADNDGKKDLLGVWSDGTLTAYLNLSTRGAISFGNQQNIGAGWNNLTKIAVVDADDDGKDDLVGTWPNGTMTAYLNTGTPGRPAFGNQQNIGVGWDGITKIVVVDSDRDGKDDLVGTWANGTMTAYLNIGTPGHPSFGNQQNIGAGWNNIAKIVVVDADRDGKDDLVATWNNGTMTAYLSIGTPGHPSFGNQQNIGTGWGGITRIVVADADGDGHDDLVGTWANGTMTAYMNAGAPGRPSFGNQQNIGTGWSGITKIATVH